jgi:hypothetical protein
MAGLFQALSKTMALGKLDTVPYSLKLFDLHNNKAPTMRIYGMALV